MKGLHCETQELSKLKFNMSFKKKEFETFSKWWKEGNYIVKQFFEHFK